MFAGLLVLALAAPPQEFHNVFLTKKTPSDKTGLDRYKYTYDLSDGKWRDESGQLGVRRVEGAMLRVRASFSWINPENGQVYAVNYVADEDGLQPQGAHLPKQSIL